MQANEFEKNIRQKMEGFQLVPDDEVWNRVEVRIAKEKRRRRVIYWWASAILLLGGIGGWWLLSGDNNHSNTIEGVSKVLNPKENLPVKKEQPVADAGNQKVPADEKQIAEEVVKYPSVKSETEAEGNIAGVQKQELTRAIRAAAGEKPAAKTGDKIQPAESQKAKTGAELLEESERSYLEDAMTELQPLAPPDSALKTVATAEKANRVKDSAALSPAKENKKPVNEKTKKLKFGFTAYAGLSDNRSGFPLIKSSNPLAYSNAFPNQSTGGSAGGFSSIAPLTYTSGFSFGFGLFTSVQLNKRTALSLGVDYHYYSSKSTVGNSTTSRNILYDSVLGQLAYLNAAYNYGTSSAFSNTYHLIELPLNLVLQINKSVQHPLHISAGILPCYLIHSNALYANRASNIYYVEKNQFKRFQISVQAGLLYSFFSTKKYRLSAGPVLQYGFTNLSKAVTGTNQHLFFTGLKTNISLK